MPTATQQAANLKRAFAEHDIPWPTDDAPRRTLFFHPTGPLVQYAADGVLHIADLNPEVKTKWRMSRKEMLKFAWRCARAALSR